DTKNTPSARTIRKRECITLQNPATPTTAAASASAHPGPPLRPRPPRPRATDTRTRPSRSAKSCPAPSQPSATPPQTPPQPANKNAPDATQTVTQPASSACICALSHEAPHRPRRRQDKQVTASGYLVSRAASGAIQCPHAVFRCPSPRSSSTSRCTTATTRPLT